MKLTVEKDALLRALGRIHRIVERRNTIPILANVLLSGRDGNLALRVTDLDIEATDSIAADLAEEGAITVSAHMLNDIVKKLPGGGAVSLDLDRGEGRLVVRSGRSRFMLPSLPEGDFPTLDAGSFGTAFALPGKDFRALFSKVQAAISTEETRFYLNGVYLSLHAGRGSGPEMRAVATDGHRLGLWAVPAPEGCEGMPSVIVPRKAVAELLRLVDDATESVSVEVSLSKVRVRIGSLTLTSKLIDGTFPDYERVVPKANDKAMGLDKAEFSTAIDRVSTVSNERGRAVALNLADGVATLTVNNPDAGSAVEEVAVDYAAAPMTIGFNAKYLHEALAEFEGERCEVLLADPGSAAIVKSPGDDRLLYVLMPMRV